jgi:hypothetical protein
MHVKEGNAFKPTIAKTLGSVAIYFVAVYITPYLYAAIVVSLISIFPFLDYPIFLYISSIFGIYMLVSLIVDIENKKNSTSS